MSQSPIYWFFVVVLGLLCIWYYLYTRHETAQHIVKGKIQVAQSDAMALQQLLAASGVPAHKVRVIRTASEDPCWYAGWPMLDRYLYIDRRFGRFGENCVGVDGDQIVSLSLVHHQLESTDVLDGLENLHDQIRNHPGAFKKVERFLGFAKDLFASVGMVVSISDQSWEAIPELLDLARDKQMDLVQLHPLEPAGRAVEHHEISLSNVNLKRAYLLYRALAPDYPFSIAFDAFTRQAAAKLLVPKESTTKMAESVDLIVVTEEGAIKPHSYQAPPEWTLGNLLYDDLPSCWENYRTHQLEAYGLWVKDQLGKVESPIFSPDRPFSVALEQ